MNYTSEQVLSLLPQRAPIVMVDGARQDEDHSFARLTIAPDNWFVDGTTFLEAGVIEHQAQSVAVCLGMRACQCQPSRNPHQIGFIAEVKNLHITRLPKVGETLQTSVSFKTEVEGVLLMSAQTECEKEIIACSELKIFLPA